MRGESIYGYTGSGCALAYFKEKIDLTNYSKLCVELEATTTHPNGVGAGKIGVVSSPIGEWFYVESKNYADIDSTVRDTHEYIIPEEFDMYSPSIWLTSAYSGTYSEVIVYNVWLEE